jgi:hypothetical protein
LLEEAYDAVLQETIGQAIGAGVRALGRSAATGAKEGAKGAAKQVGQQAGAAAVTNVAGKFRGQQAAAPAEVPAEDEGAVDVELESWWEYDPHDVMVKVYHGALHQLPPQQGTPEYEANFEKVFSWLEGKYPQHSEEVDASKYRRNR